MSDEKSGRSYERQLAEYLQRNPRAKMSKKRTFSELDWDSQADIPSHDRRTIVRVTPPISNYKPGTDASLS